MKIIVNNKAGIPNKYIRLAVWKLKNLNKRLKRLIYAEIFIQHHPGALEPYETVIKLGIPGNDIIIKERSKDLKKLWANTLKKVVSSVKKYKDRLTDRSKGHKMSWT